MTAILPASILAFIFGACIGSFLNVCIYRIPAGASIVHPGSSCPRCKTMIPFYDNIPILSYLMLTGKCRNCRTPIAIRYPLVELLTGLFALACLLVFGPTMHGLVAFTFIATLIVVAFIDLDHRIGNFKVGKEADFVVLDLQATALMEQRMQNSGSLEDKLFALMM